MYYSDLGGHIDTIGIMHGGGVIALSAVRSCETGVIPSLTLDMYENHLLPTKR